ncbi:hypothetical protein E0K89_019440 [Aquicoccus sp. SCR17]|nr:hypothetical protein [Carideicomes alvinocaridis]
MSFPDNPDLLRIESRLMFDPHTELALKAHFFGVLTEEDAVQAMDEGLIEEVQPSCNGEGRVFRLTEKSRGLLWLPEEAMDREYMLAVSSMLFLRFHCYLFREEHDDVFHWTRDPGDQVFDALNRALDEALAFWRKKGLRPDSHARK